MRIQPAQKKRPTKTGLRWGLVLGLGLIVVGAALWYGEDLASAAPTAVIFLTLVSIVLAYFVSPCRSVLGSLCVASLVALCVAGGWFTGRAVAVSAFNECVERGELVRMALTHYRAQHDEFPENLDDLGLADLPGRRWVRGPMLSYRRTPDGYELTFSDWLATHKATESHAFAAMK